MKNSIITHQYVIDDFDKESDAEQYLFDHADNLTKGTYIILPTYINKK